MARRVIEGNKHLAAAQPLAADIVLDDGIAALEAVLIAKTFEDTLRRVTLLAMTMPILFQDLIDDRGEPIQLRTKRRGAAAIARGNREPQHLANRLAVQPKYPRRLVNTHPADTTRAANPRIQLHSIHPPRLRSDQS